MDFGLENRVMNQFSVRKFQGNPFHLLHWYIKIMKTSFFFPLSLIVLIDDFHFFSKSNRILNMNLHLLSPSLLFIASLFYQILRFDCPSLASRSQNRLFAIIDPWMKKSFAIPYMIMFMDHPIIYQLINSKKNFNDYAASNNQGTSGFTFHGGGA